MFYRDSSYIARGEFRFPLRNIPALTLAVTLLVSGCASESPEQNDPSCINPSATDITTVDELLSATEETGESDEVEPAYSQDLTVYDYTAEYQDLFNNIVAGDGPTYTLPFSTYYEAAREFGMKYGVEVNIPEEGGFSQGAEPLNISDLENKTAKAAMISLIRTLGRQPVELVRWTGLKSIDLIDIPGSVNGYVQLHDATDTFYADPNIGFSPEVFRHELYHLVDSKACEDIGIDPGYSRLNPEDLYTNPDKYLSYTDIQSDAELEEILMSAGRSADAAEYTAQLDELGPDVATFNPYGESKLGEDKATLGAELLNPGDTGTYDKLTSKRYTLLREKAVFLLARLHALRPEYAEFLISSRNKQWR